MAYDEGLAERVRSYLHSHHGVSEKKMFGGLCVLHDGNMLCGVLQDELMVRVGPDAWPELVKLPFAREMDFTGKSMRGMVYVASEGIAEDDELATWIEHALKFVAELPAK